MLVSECSVVLFFKQMSAYDMRISDWSSDVCSSDLALFGRRSQRIGYTFRGPIVIGRKSDTDVAIIENGIVLAIGLFDLVKALREIGRAACRERVGQYV